MKLKKKDFLPQDFINAAKILDERGWCRYVELTPSGKVCAVGALSLARAQRLGIKVNIKKLIQKDKFNRISIISEETSAPLWQTIMDGFHGGTCYSHLSVNDLVSETNDKPKATKQSVQNALILSGLLLKEEMKKKK